MLLFVLGCAAQVFLLGCGAQEESDPVSEGFFRRLTPEQTGIDFQNVLSEAPTPNRNELLFEYFSNGAGVAAGDLNGDGLDDLYFTGNMTYSALYLNRGSMTFEDVTDAAGVAGRKDTWKTGVTMADVDGDGLLDIYVCYSGDLPMERRVDELYINQGSDANGVPQFREMAMEFGLANPHSSNQAYFFDYDGDGDLDLFLLTHNVKQTPRRDSVGTRVQLEEEDPVSGFRFYRNDGSRFVDVTSDTGIRSSGLSYGLGAGVSDFNQDGWIDLYVGNDYSPPDYLYINNGDGTFTDELGARIGHTSRASMGIDAADVNNDGLTDIVVLDMLAEDHRRQKLLFVPDDRDHFETMVRSGFHHQYMRNTLQLNNGDDTFSEVGQLAGISNTDWSWAPLIADFDNDGFKDIYITNGTLHDLIHRDFLIYKSNYTASKEYELRPADIAHLMEMLPSSVDINNYMFKNLGGIVFADVTADWGLGLPLKSTGATYADLDGDGDLDLITNNINEHAYVFENRSADLADNNYLQLELVGDGANTRGIGARTTLFAGGAKQVLEQVPARGYLSSVSPTLHFGMAKETRADSLHVVWPDGRTQTMKDVEANQRLSILQKNAAKTYEPSSGSAPAFLATPSPIVFEHSNANVDDFRRQPLMVTPQSFLGPAMAGADVNGDGLSDVFVGGGSGQPSRLYLQQKDGRFTVSSQPAFETDKRSDDVDAVFVDVNHDGHLDLYVASGGYGDFSPEDEALQDRLYVNDGSGNFRKDEEALPEMRTSTGTVAAGDINGDGQADLFVGGRVVPGRYPETPRSYILINNGTGQLEDRTATIAPQLERIGMVTDAAWHDLYGDDALELIIVGEWIPISVFEITGGILSDETERYFSKRYTGLWNAIHVADLNGDGIADIVAGNHGLNSQLKAREDQPARLYYADFDYDGAVEPILTYYIGGVSYPFVTLDELWDEMPAVGARFRSYTAYSEAQLEDVLTQNELEKASRLEVECLETSLFLGSKDGRFEKKSLPLEAQFSPVFAVQSMDYNEDGYSDLILAGNQNEARIRFGKYDANYGMLLKASSDASFEYVPQYMSGFSIRGDVRSMLQTNGMLLFGINRGAIQAYGFRGE